MKNLKVTNTKLSKDKAIEMFEKNGIKCDSLKPLKIKGKECDDVDYMIIASEYFDELDRENSNKNLPTDYGFDPDFVKLAREVTEAYNEGVSKKDLYRYINSVIRY